jgi:hypothetical protein
VARFWWNNYHDCERMMATRNLPQEITGKANGTSLSLPGTSGNYASAPYVAAMGIAGDIDIRWFGSRSVLTSGVVGTLVGRRSTVAGDASWILNGGARIIRLYYSVDGTALGSIESNAQFADGIDGTLGVRCVFQPDNGAGGKTATFYTSNNAGDTWDLFGTPVTDEGAISMHTAVGQLLEVGSNNNGANSNVDGTVQRVEVRDGIDGTIVANPDFTGGKIGKDGAGNVWTINGSDAGYVYADGSAAPVFDISANADTIAGKASGTSLSLPGISGNYASAPHDASFAITGDLDLRCIAALPDWTPAVSPVWIARYIPAGNQRAYLFRMNTNGTLSFNWSADGVTDNLATSLAAVPFTDGSIGGVRVTIDVSVRTVTFYTSSDEGATWDQLGNVIGGAATSIFAATADLVIGQYTTNTTGTVLSASVRDGIDGTIVANPDFTRGTIGKDGVGNVWTINGSDAGYVDAQGESVTVQGSYVDETVGRRAFTWDAANGRWQMTYGDTGWRGISADLLNSWAGSATGVSIRREGNTVTVAVGYRLDGSSATSDVFYAVPTGFLRSTLVTGATILAGTLMEGSNAGIAASYTALALVGFESASYDLQCQSRNLALTGYLSWHTADAWPTSLPGTAVGSIPSGFAEKAATGAIPVDEIEDAETGTADIETKPKPKPKPRKGRK